MRIANLDAFLKLAWNLDGYNELLRLVHYNQQGVGYNETEKPKRFTKFHYI